MFNLTYIVEVKNPENPEMRDSGAWNEFYGDNQDNCLIIHFLENFHYRKNVSYKKVANDINEYFVMEFICATIRKLTGNTFEKDPAPCGDDDSKCVGKYFFDIAENFMKRKRKIVTPLRRACSSMEEHYIGCVDVAGSNPTKSINKKRR